MKKLTILCSVALATLFSCSEVPVTGRHQLDLVPNSEVLAMSNQSYSQFLQQNKLSSNQQQIQEVKTVGTDLSQAVERYFREHNMTNELKGYNWEFNLVESNEINAWCMPGGKVVVYTGIMPVAQDETGLAVVMGHEIAHAIAKHGNERMSQALTAELGGVALQVALKDKPQQTQSLFYAAYGAGTTVGVLLPFSRVQESEADRLGLIFMAMAGYDPNAAVAFWERMEAQAGGSKTPEFLSTHPSAGTRIQNIKQHIPEAMKYYNPSARSSR